MTHQWEKAGAALAVCSLVALASCMDGSRAMSGYYTNHPEMMARLLKVRTIFVGDVRGARDSEEAIEMKGCIVDEMGRRGKGRFRIAAVPAKADAVLETDMTEELGPVPAEEPLPFTLENKLVSEKIVYARMKLTDPKTGRLIYKTDTREQTEFEVSSVEKAAYTVVKNFMNAREYCRQTIAP
jgi:hypothetical protein